MTHAYVLLEVSPASFAEVRAKMEASRYDHALLQGSDGRELADMHGIALTPLPDTTVPGSTADTWGMIRSEVVLGITAVPDEDGTLRDRCVGLLDGHARDLAALRAALSDIPPDRVGWAAPVWVVRLYRAACAAAGVE